MTKAASATDYGPRHLIVELTNICNLHCSYCLRDEDALYHTPANFFPFDLFRRITREAREAAQITQVMFTGGEATLHPRFKEIIAAVADEGLKCSFVTNGWHFERIWPAISAHREAVTHVAFSLDGATREAHDRWRGEGSFVRLVRGFSRCLAANLPFTFKVSIRRDTFPQLEQIALFAARMGAAGLHFGHLIPTSGAFEDELGLSREERAQAELEVAALARIFKMNISIEVGYENLNPDPPCVALAGSSYNVNYRGELSLCCNLSGYRGATTDADVVADLTKEGFAPAYARLLKLVEEQLERRRVALAGFSERGEKPDLYTAAPCLFCLQSLGKLHWRGAENVADASRSLPVLPSV